MYVFAIIGSTAPALGQTDLETQSEQEEAAQQQVPARIVPVPLPVEIVEDQAAAVARQSREEESRRNEIADLAAQEGMNTATQAIKDATFDMRDYALYSTILVGLGTFLAFAAFVLSLLANRSAREAVDVMRQEQRPWIKAVLVEALRTPGKFQHWHVKLQVSNIGNTPAMDVVTNMIIKDCLLESKQELRKFVDFAITDLNRTSERAGGRILFPEESYDRPWSLSLDENLTGGIRHGIHPVVLGCVSYRTGHSDQVRVTAFAFVIDGTSGVVQDETLEVISVTDGGFAT